MEALRWGGAAVLILRGTRVLVVHNVAGERQWWSLPGGRVEPGETLGEAAVREVLEETGYRVRLTGLLRLREKITSEGHVAGGIFRGEIIAGAEDTSRDPVGVVQKVRWVTAGEVGRLLDPITAELASDVLRGTAEAGQYREERRA